MTRQELIDYCLAFAASYEDYSFDDFTDAGAWTAMRHRTNTKTFAFIYERHRQERNLLMEERPYDCDTESGRCVFE
jgi:predicted DNA-binding protein (MmcQ/YjbR family)